MKTTLSELEILLQQIASLLLYQNVLADLPGQTYLALLQELVKEGKGRGDRDQLLYAYGDWFRAMATTQQNWQDYLLSCLLRDNNPFTQQVVQHHDLSKLPPAVVAAARHDLRILQRLHSSDGDRLLQWWAAIAPDLAMPIGWCENHTAHSDLQARLHRFDDWAEALEIIAAIYRSQGVGVFAQFKAFRWQAGELMGIPHPDPVQPEELVGYETQKETLLKNTQALLNGYPALHVLLYGSRGSGKSSLVKSLLNKLGDRGLRLVEVAKSELYALPEIVERLQNSPLKFIIFVDDLSFEEDDDAYKALKVVLEGTLTARPANVVVYATSNRRHLIREFFDDRPRPRDADEIHHWDTVQEKLSFSDRFGLTLTFEPADQLTYLQIVQALATQFNLSLPTEELEFRALQWATRHNGRSGRSARQFIDFLRAELAMAG
ncbi:MAG TPA: ATP-binding protein [Leptolyngbyaceae cyanobacterium M33_DOE_097]|uniref:ATP-binding protein n=1 Tax=Oscillatoriales cyanobacterium SpSt-418 TaxID=2282169 RepID=A0A7C3KF70_9CYAN|nr:ATP-binding protein [Leptolyngbyaceae cyanobacterium M33_DOE_097]